MSKDNCCYGCTPPKRNPYCHATCPEYAAQSAANAERRDKRNAEKLASIRLTQQRGDAVKKATRKNKRRSHGA